jgi:hypothetical protein
VVRAVPRLDRERVRRLRQVLLMFLGAPLSHAWSTVVRSKRMLLVSGFVEMLVCLPPAAYVLRNVDAAAGRRVDALAIAQHFDPDFMADLRARTPSYDDDLTALCVASFVAFFFVRTFLSAGYVGLAASRRPSRLAHFVREGASTYWKFLRLAAAAGVAAYLLSIAAKPLLAQVEEWAKLRAEPTAIRYRLVTQLVVFAAFCLVAMIFDYARVGVRLHRRPGVFAEVGRAALFVLQHPASTIALLVLSLAIEMGAVLACGWLVQIADGGYFTTTAIVLVLVQFVVTLREAARLFHLAGAWQLRAGEAGEERKAPEVIAPEADRPDVLGSPLPWNTR